MTDKLSDRLRELANEFGMMYHHYDLMMEAVEVALRAETDPPREVPLPPLGTMGIPRQ